MPRAKFTPGKQSEAQIQIAVMQWWALACRGLGVHENLLHHSPNGGKRNIITAANFKRMGTRAGWPDLFLAAPRTEEVRVGSDTVLVQRGGLFVELKAGTGRLEPTQKALHAELTRAGYAVAVAWSVTEAINAITNYLATGNAGGAK